MIRPQAKNYPTNTATTISMEKVANIMGIKGKMNMMRMLMVMKMKKIMPLADPMVLIQKAKLLNGMRHARRRPLPVDLAFRALLHPGLNAKDPG